MVFETDKEEAKLSDFGFDEIIEYLGEEIDEIEPNAFDDFLELLQSANSRPIIINSLNAKMKFEYLCKVFEKYTLEQFETLLPE